MRNELDKLLCEKYPKMMVNRNKSMTETCMCWGFDCGDGWFNLLDQLMGNIQHHIDWQNNQRKRLLENNKYVHPIPQEVPQVTLDQVKEKFGTLRFYYTGGDDHISGMVRMAESMSGVICEECSNPAKTGNDQGWVRTLCGPCVTKREEARAEYAKKNGLEE